MSPVEEKIASDTQYAVGAFDAIAALLAIIARHQGLDLRNDLEKLDKRNALLHPKLEADRVNGSMNVIGTFQDVFFRLR